MNKVLTRHLTAFLLILLIAVLVVTLEKIGVPPVWVLSGVIGVKVGHWTRRIEPIQFLTVDDRPALCWRWSSTACLRAIVGNYPFGVVIKKPIYGFTMPGLIVAVDREPV